MTNIFLYLLDVMVIVVFPKQDWYSCMYVYCEMVSSLLGSALCTSCSCSSSLSQKNADEAVNITNGVRQDLARHFGR